MWEIGDRMAKAAALMTDTEVSMKVLGSAWPGHFNKTIAETCTRTSKGRPAAVDWADQALAKALQHELKVPEVAWRRSSSRCAAASRFPTRKSAGGGSDDIGDIS